MRHEYDNALTEYKKAVALQPDNPTYLLAAGRTANRLGTERNNAEMWLKHGHVLQEKKKKNNDTMLAEFKKELALLYSCPRPYDDAQKLYKNAEKLYYQAIEIYKSADEQLAAASVQSCLAELYRKKKNYDSAESLYQEALSVKQKGLENTNDPLIAADYNGLALIAKEHKNYEQALEYLEKSIDICNFSANLNKICPDIDIYFNNKAEILEEVGRNDEAEAAYNDAITLCERTSPKGKTCRNVKENYKNLQRKMSALEKEG